MSTRVYRNGRFFACTRLRARTAQNDGVVEGLTRPLVRRHPEASGADTRLMPKDLPLRKSRLSVHPYESMRSK